MTYTATHKNNDVKRTSILGVPVNIINMQEVVTTATTWAATSPARTVFVRDVASLMLAVESHSLRKLHHSASLVVPDGLPLVWIGKARGFGKRIGRVSGADLVDAICAASVPCGQTHFFYGGKPGVAEEMVTALARRHPGLRVAGVLSPPMRDIGPDFFLSDDALAEIDAIKTANPDFIWVGISSPKQEYWMTKAAPHFKRGVFFGVGAAFDFHSGRVMRAPRWMSNIGFEWLHRLASEPRRLWYRYLVLAPLFVVLVAKDAVLNTSRNQESRRNVD